jgi:GNAT superfamily N-acetyltransferase
VPDLLRIIERAVERACSGHYDGAQRRAVMVSYARNLFYEVLGRFDTVLVQLHARVVAFAQLDAADCRLRALFVDARVQERGLGTLLLEHMLALAARRGCTRLHGAMSLNAVPFYARAGFARCDGSAWLVNGGVRVPVVPMQRAITAERD